MLEIGRKEHRKRLRERFRSAGSGGFADHELLELLLTYAIPRQDVKDRAKGLLKECGDLLGVLTAPEDILQKVEGIGPEASLFLRFVGTIITEATNPQRRKEKNRLRSVAEAICFVRDQLQGCREEEMHVIALDAKNQAIGHTCLARGTGDHVSVYPRKVLEFALSTKAVAVLVAHNHPSGDPQPSEDDLRLTKTLEKAAAAVGVRWVDHLIIGDGDQNYSFRTGALVPAANYVCAAQRK